MDEHESQGKHHGSMDHVLYYKIADHNICLLITFVIFNIFHVSSSVFCGLIKLHNAHVRVRHGYS